MSADLTPLSRVEIAAINARADEQGRTVEYVFAPVGRRERLRCVRAVIRNQAWVLSHSWPRPR